jgi:hypothetical protein
MDNESSGVLVKERPLNYVRTQNHILSSGPSLEELRLRSKALLYCILYGDNSAGEDRFFRELYWYTIEALAYLESGR